MTYCAMIRVSRICKSAWGSSRPRFARLDLIAIEESNSRVYIYYPPLESGAADLKRLFVDYSWQELVKNVVLVIGDNPEWLIDNDDGLELPGDQFVAWLRNRKTVLGPR
jgi:hypothetical protein